MSAGAETGFAVARVLACGIWAIAGLYKALHFRATVADMRHHRIPVPEVVLCGVLVMEMGGSALMIANRYVWAVALAWIGFTIPASILYHRHVSAQGVDFVQMLLFWKNVSILGGLVALILLDPSRPDWLLRG